MNKYVVEIETNGIQYPTSPEARKFGSDDTWYDHVTIELTVRAENAEDAEFAVREMFPNVRNCYAYPEKD